MSGLDRKDATPEPREHYIELARLADLDRRCMAAIALLNRALVLLNNPTKFDEAAWAAECKAVTALANVLLRQQAAT